MNIDRQSLLETLAFRLAFVYFILYSTCSLIPPLSDFVWNPVVIWVGTKVLGIEGLVGVMPNGSGDQTEHYLMTLVFFVLAVVAAAIWIVRDRGRATYPRLAAWTTVAARYWLGMIMFGYGMAKVFHLQMPSPDYIRLTDTYGESSPMRLLWTFMGASPLYSAFAGGLEVLGGVLLFWRRTTSLGALVCIGVLANVVALNLAYDVPVKLFSTHLLVVALVLAGQDAERLIGVLVLGRAVPARVVLPVTTTVRGHRIRWTIKGLFLVGLAVQTTLQVRAHRQWLAPDPLQGVYDVVAHEVECDPARTCEGDLRWRRLVFGRSDIAAIDRLRGSRTKHWASIDEGELVLTPLEEGYVMRFAHEGAAEGTLILEGSFGGAEHRITLERVDDPAFLLVDRGFHWINEYPFNY